MTESPQYFSPLQLCNIMNTGMLYTVHSALCSFTKQEDIVNISHVFTKSSLLNEQSALYRALPVFIHRVSKYENMFGNPLTILTI